MHLNVWAITTFLFLVGSAFSNSVVDTAGENVASNLRIIGGIDAQDGQYPFMASLLSPRSACAGTLIAPSYVLTAAHCVSLPSTSTKDIWDSNVFLNTLGVAGDETNSVTNYVSKIIVHENYSVNGTGYVNDIAIIVLEFPVTTVTPVQIAEETTTTQTKTTTKPTTKTTTKPTTKTTTKPTTKTTTKTTTKPTTKTTTRPTTKTTTRPTTKTTTRPTTKTTTKPTIKTTTKPTTKTTKPTTKTTRKLTTKKVALIRNSYENSNAIIAGWGLTSDGGYSSDTLKAADVKILTNQDCGQKWGSLFNANTMMCAAGSTSSICVDDEGGPILVNGSQVGIASFFSSSSQCNDPNAPAVFTRVSAYAGWIAQTMAENPPSIPNLI
ncbi:cell wall protein DAN4-like [Daphnia pulicaria]|uniref:cell wall protein DAN4-like n=1 Tax=Daphnia pulicaria TaxID=35523 RepID=UPI001EEA4836|nr:cell wall protein DAN4-like [Daphnia pulicaria]